MWEVDGCHPEGDSTWWLLQLAVEKPSSMPGGSMFCFLAQTGLENTPSPCRGSISYILGSFQSGGTLSGWRALTIECLIMSGCGQGHELVKDMWKELWLKFPGLVEIQVKKGVTSLSKTSRKYNSVVKGLT